MSSDKNANSMFSTGTIIHIFALAHAAVAMISRSLNYYDDILLTVLTISMIVIISIRHRLQLEMAVILTLIASFFGYLAGVYGALALRTIIRSDFLAPALTTFIITEITGWCTYFIARRKNPSNTFQVWNYTSTYIVVIAVAILVLRVGYIILLRHLYPAEDGVSRELEQLFSNTLAMVLLISLNLLGVSMYVRNRRNIHTYWGAPLFISLYLFTISAITSLVVLYGESFQSNINITISSFIKLFVVVLFISIAAFAMISLAHFVISSRRELNSERQQRHLAQYQYNKFKQQINPHFLFNSLNILDAMVQEGQQDRASVFIRKLAGMYRYMLHSEQESLVTLREEMEFSGMYIDLIKERFSNGLEIENRVPKESLGMMIVPCSLQQLIENATKHNIVSQDEPLKITIEVEGDILRVENNLQPRISQRTGSTRLGLRGISQQYVDISGRDIKVEKSANNFRVELPLIKISK